MSHFKLISSTKASNVVPVYKYISEKTGITVVIANVEGPVCNGYFCLATEAHDDDGLPHTLEHLIFLGSERYPYKGILDLLANRCLADGTNAWTDTDHTCYTIRTAGSEGILTLLPIYLDHILNPTLTEHAFVTEIHHIDECGQDAGVVYCEMQGRENSGESRCHLEMLRAVYPNSGYSAETGGIMANLRDSTNNEKVRSYHKKFYRPENLCIILTGQIKPEDVFRSLETVEIDIVAKREAHKPQEWSKPWQDIPPLPRYGVLNVDWPADTEDCGTVMLGWRGPCLTQTNALKDLAGCSVLIRYMCETLTAPLQRDLVQIEDALAGDICFNIIENISPLLIIEVENVPISKLERALNETKRTLSRLRSGEEQLDMVRLKRLLKKQLRESIAQLESEPHHAIALQCIGDMLYSRTKENFIERLNPQEILKELQKESSHYWLNLLKSNYSDEFVTVIGKPSIKLQQKMEEVENKRVEKQKQQLGENGLKEKERILLEAMKYNEREPPAGTLASIPIPSCDTIRNHNIETWFSKGDIVCPYLDINRIPLYTRIHSLKTNFVYLNLLFDTTHLDNECRRWIPLLLAELGECDILRDGCVVDYQTVAAELEENTLDFRVSVGFNNPGTFSVGSFGNNICLSFQCEPCDYEKVVNLVWDIIYSTQLNKDRLLIYSQRLINEVAQVRRKGNKMASDLLKDALYKDNSNFHWCTALRQHTFLTSLINRLNNHNEADKVVEEAFNTHKSLFKHVWLHLATDLERYKISTEPWMKFNNIFNENLPSIVMDNELIHEVLPVSGCIVGVGGIESNFMYQAWEGPLGFTHEDLAPLMVTLNYFTQLEGPMWRLIRGCGLSYGYSLSCSVHEGLLLFMLFKATNVVAAYNKANSILEDYLSGGCFDENLFASAKSSVVFEIVDREKSTRDVVKQSLLNYFRGVDTSYNRSLVCSVNNVTPEKAHTVGIRWLGSARKKSNFAVVSHPKRVNDMQKAFENIGVMMEAYESIEGTHLNK